MVRLVIVVGTLLPPPKRLVIYPLETFTLVVATLPPSLLPPKTL